MASPAVLVVVQTLLLALALASGMESVTGSGEETEGGALTEAGLPLEPASRSSFVRRRLGESFRRGDLGSVDPCKALNSECQKKGQTCCPKLGLFAECVDTKTDNDNCGGCGKDCSITKPVCCASVCTNTFTDTKNCGFCGKKCPGKCILGFCNYNGKD